MRISDWSSDVCSSDLWAGPVGVAAGVPHVHQVLRGHEVDERPGHGEAAEAGVEHPDGAVVPPGSVLVVPRFGDDRDHPLDRKSVVWGKRGSVRVGCGGRRIIKQKQTKVVTDTN